MTERVAIIDLGSNSARLIIMHIYHNGAYNLVYHQKETLRLSQGLDSEQRLSADAARRCTDTLARFAHMCALFHADKIIAVATAAIRNAANGREFLQTVCGHSGIPVRIISGEEEAQAGFTGVINTIGITDALLFDLGGGSTELTLVKNRRVKKSISLPIGAVNLTEKFKLQDQVTAEQLAELENCLSKQLGKLRWLSRLSLPLIGMGGTARNIAKIDQRRKNYPFAKVHNYRLGSFSLQALWNDLAGTTLIQRRKIPGLSKERADIIVAGTGIVKCLFDATAGTNLIVSGCGVREGLFLQYYLELTGQKPVVDDILLHSTNNMLLFYKGDANHARHVANLADNLFVSLTEVHGLGPRERTLLQTAALLHDIGITINYYDHPRHSAYLVENARLFGLTHREQMLVAVIAGWHHGPSGKYMRNRLYNDFLDETDWQTARKLALLLAIAAALDCTQTGVVKKIGVNLTPAAAVLHISADSSTLIECDAARVHAKWFKRELGRELQILESFVEKEDIVRIIRK